MPPKKKTTAPVTLTISCFSRGSGMTAGLEVWSIQTSSVAPPKFLLYDRSTDGRFASDVATWNGAAGLTSAVLTSFVKAAAAASA